MIEDLAMVKNKCNVKMARINVLTKTKRMIVDMTMETGDNKFVFQN
jgi:hypothetical protein